MKTKLYILFVSFLVVSSCSETNHSKKGFNLDSKKMSILKISYPIKSNPFTIGMDTESPIYSDTIIVLRNELSKHYKLLNVQKIKYLDSVSFCKLVRESFEKEKIYMKPFLLIERKEDNIKIFAVTWSISYYDFKTDSDKPHCIELYRELLQEY